MPGIRVQLLQKPKVLVFLRTAARHLQCPLCLKATAKGRNQCHPGIKGCCLCPHEAGRQSLCNTPGIQSKAQMRLKWCQVLAVFFFPLTSCNAYDDEHQCPLLYVKGQHVA